MMITQIITLILLIILGILIYKNRKHEHEIIMFTIWLIILYVSWKNRLLNLILCRTWALKEQKAEYQRKRRKQIIMGN